MPAPERACESALLPTNRTQGVQRCSYMVTLLPWGYYIARPLPFMEDTLYVPLHKHLSLEAF